MDGPLIVCLMLGNYSALCCLYALMVVCREGEMNTSSGRVQILMCVLISRFDMSCAQAHRVGSKPIRRVMQLKLHQPTMAIGYSLRMCSQRRFDQSRSK